MASWRNPAEGYTTFSSSQSDLFALKQVYDDVILVADAAKSTIASAWTAEGSAALQLNVQTYRGTLPEVQDVLTTARQAVIDYKTSLSAIQSAADGWLTQYNNMNHQLNQTDRNVLADPVGAADDAADRIVNLVRFQEARWELEQLYTRRGEADNALIAALGAAMPASWADTSAAFTASGITQSMLLSSSQSKDAILDLAQRMLDGDMSDENVAALSGLLSVWGNNQSTMSSVFTQLGGANAAQLIDQLGEKMSYESGAYGTLADGDQAVLTLANHIRSGLATGAQNWGPDYAESYMRDMLTGNTEYFDRRRDDSSNQSGYSAQAMAASFLFSGAPETPMPEPLAYAAALIVDELEHEGGKNNLYNVIPPEAGISSSVFGMYTADGVFTGELSQNDLPGRVFETLGLYPDASLEFLTGGDGRIEYWYGDRDWSVADDGFAGPAALWLGAAQVDGSESTTVASEIMFELFDNKSFISENVTDEGSIYLAGAVGADLGALAEYVAAHPSDDITQFGSDTVELFGKDSTVDSPIVNGEVLANILGIIGGHEGGSLLLQDHATALQNAYFAYGITHPESFEGAMRQADLLQGAIDGSGIGERVAAAERSDTAREEMIEGISTLIGFVPIPGGSGLIVHGGVALADYAQDVILSLGQDAVTNLIIGSQSDYASAISQMGLDESSLAERMTTINGLNTAALLQSDSSQALLQSAGYDASSLGSPPELGTFENPDAYAIRTQQWVDTHSDQLDAAAQIVLGNPEFGLDKKNVDYENGSGNYVKLVQLSEDRW